MNRIISVHTVFVAVHVLSAVLTVIPQEGASKACRLGYKCVCSFTPWGTLILLALAGLHFYLHRRSLARQN